jgi:alpha-glucuronidase
MKFTKHNLKKLQDLLAELGYEVRYEKGNFQSGYCVVTHRKMAVINKYFDTEGRMNSLMDIIQSVDKVDIELTPAARATLKEIEKNAVV